MSTKPFNRTVAKQWSIMTALFLWGFLSFLVLCGDDTPNNPMSNTVFFVSKVLAGASLWLCVKTGKVLNRKGLLPDKRTGGRRIMTAEIQSIHERLDRLERITPIGAKSVLDLDEACLFTGFSKGYLYRLTSARKVPHFKKNRKLYFDKQQLEHWLLAQEIPTDEQINRQATTRIAISRMK